MSDVVTVSYENASTPASEDISVTMTLCDSGMA